MKSAMLIVVSCFLFFGCMEEPRYSVETLEDAPVSTISHTTTSTTECVVDKNCSTGFYCDKGQCVECVGGSCQDPDCITGSDCNDNNPCTTDVCKTDGTCGYNYLNGKTCESDGVCFAGECTHEIIQVECNTVADCDDVKDCTIDSCVNGTCLHAPRSGACDDHNPNTINDTCVVGVCVGETKPECTVAEDCDKGEECVSGKCEALPECIADADCDDDNPLTIDTCKDGECTYKVPECTMNSGCDDGDGCTNNICTPAGKCEFVIIEGCECTNDNDCKDNNAYTKDVCVAMKCHHNVIACIEDNDCNDNNSCTDDTCTANSCVHQDNGECECDTDSDCDNPPEDYCSSNKLWSYDSEGECVAGACVYGKTATTCSYGCQDGECLVECTKDSDCDSDEECHEGTCQTVYECTSDSNCSSGYSCVNHECVLEEDECTQSSDCPNYYSCLNGECVYTGNNDIYGGYLKVKVDCSVVDVDGDGQVDLDAFPVIWTGASASTNSSIPASNDEEVSVKVCGDYSLCTWGGPLAHIAVNCNYGWVWDGGDEADFWSSLPVHHTEDLGSGQIMVYFTIQSVDCSKCP